MASIVPFLRSLSFFSADGQGGALTLCRPQAARSRRPRALTGARRCGAVRLPVGKKRCPVRAHRLVIPHRGGVDRPWPQLISDGRPDDKTDDQQSSNEQAPVPRVEGVPGDDRWSHQIQQREGSEIEMLDVDRDQRGGGGHPDRETTGR